MAVRDVTLLSSGLAKSFKRPPPGMFYLVGESGSVPLIFRQLRDASAEMNTLDIYAHGVFINRYGNGIVGDIAEFFYGHDVLQGAYGVSIGKDFLNAGNVDMFGTLAGCFAAGGFINLYVCGAAATNPTDPDQITAPNVWSGNGIGLCQTIADLSGAKVHASTSWFHFRKKPDGTEFDPIGFSGEVYVFAPSKPRRLESR